MSALTQLTRELHDRLQREMWGRQLISLFRRVQDSGGAADNAGASVASGLSTTLGAIANAFIVLFVGIYLAINPGWYRRGLLRLIPPGGRRETRDILDDIVHSLRGWLFGRAVGMTVVGVITGFGLWLLHVPFALGLGLIAAIFDFVPFVGPIAAAAPAILMAAAAGRTRWPPSR